MWTYFIRVPPHTVHLQSFSLSHPPEHAGFNEYCIWNQKLFEIFNADVNVKNGIGAFPSVFNLHFKKTKYVYENWK